MSRLAEQWKSGRVLRLNTANEVNKHYAEQIGVANTPTFILFDAAGGEIRRWSSEAPTVMELP